MNHVCNKVSYWSDHCNQHNKGMHLHCLEIDVSFLN